MYDSNDPDFSLLDLFICFTHCPLLENLVIPISMGDWHFRRCLPDELPPTIGLSHLSHLYLDFSYAVDPCRLFDRLFLPALICLELTMSLGHITDWHHVQTMLANSRPPLQSLILWSVPMTEETLIGCLSYVPTLNELELHGMPCSDRILDSLTVDEAGADGSRYLCPWLETVNFGTTKEDNCDFSPRAMTDMIVSRWRDAKNSGFTRGNTLTLVVCRFKFSRIRSNPEIAQCLNDGLVLTRRTY
ncbi:hypothetical protein BD410DRAFT_510014 [Rickenella mellea]|uniref:F-box domain-containing protein n=1 Tax=Rickenella mellea TaxID=50990 RepID=A0A4Y7PTE4_9AGAM|nr:hypothetical protein BD410DRAFT_510014 [Rickenella mellea]